MNFRKAHASILALTLLFLLASWSPAQDILTAPPLDRAAVLRSAAEATREKYPNADDVLIDDVIRVRYETDGTSVQTDETYLKVLTEKGKRDNQTLSLHFTLPYGDASVDLLETIKPDGRVVPVDIEAQSRVMTDPSQMGSNIYNPNTKILRIGIPGLEAGDVLHYRAIRRIVKARVPKTWSDYMVFEYTSPIKRMVYEVDGPAALPLRSLGLKSEVEGTVRPTREEKGDRILYRWEVSDVPRMYEEPDMPPLYTVVQRLLVSTIPDWRDISRWYWNLSKPHLETTEEIERTVAELTKDAPDALKKTEAIFTWVSQKVRYMGITTEAEAPGYEPHDVSVTFENKYGVCRDKAALLVAMLREAGIDAYPALIHNGPKKDEDVPQPYFNHAIVAAELEKGIYTLMDPTDENTREFFPSYLSNQSYLVAKSEGETLLTSPIVPAEENMMRIEMSGRIDANGALSAECLLRFEGINDNAYRGYFARIRPDQQREYFETVAGRVVPGARMTDFALEPYDLLDNTRPLVARLKIEAGDVPIVGEDVLMLPVPRFGGRVGMVNFVLGQAGLEERKYPLITKIACGVEQSLTLDIGELADGAVSLPDYPPIEDDAVAYVRTLEQEGNLLKGKTTFKLKVVEFSPGQYRELKNTLQKIEFYGRKMPIFEARPAASDAVVLSHTVDYYLFDNHSWAETIEVEKNILTYAGKKANAEIKISYNPAWDHVSVERAQVIAPDGTSKEVRAEETNLMDAAWVGSAPRYPAQKTLVVSLPNVDVGSVIRYRIRKLKNDRPFFSATHVFRGFDPVRYARVSVNRPNDIVLKRAERLGGEMERYELSLPDADRVRETWSVLDQPQIKRESNLPPLYYVAPALFLSTGDWEEYTEEANRALTAAARKQPEATGLARELIENTANREDRVRIIRDFVAKNVRAAGPGFSDLPLSAITPADRILKDGYGNSADRAVLLCAMLRTAGLDPEFVLASRMPALANENFPAEAVPRNGPFDDVLVQVSLKPRRILYLNDTNQYAALGATPHDGQYALFLDDEKLQPVRADLPDMRKQSFAVALQPNGDAVVIRTTLYLGNAYGAFHRRFAEMPPEERRRYQQEAVAGIAQSAEPIGDLVTEYDAYPGREILSVRVKKFAVVDGDDYYLSIPASFGILRNLRGQTRANPLYRYDRENVMVTCGVLAPEGFERLVLHPKPSSWTGPVDAGTVRISASSRTFEMPSEGKRGDFPAPWDELREFEGRPMFLIHMVARLNPTIVPADDYDKLLELQRRVTHPASRTLLFSRN